MAMIDLTRCSEQCSGVCFFPFVFCCLFFFSFVFLVCFSCLFFSVQLNCLVLS